MTRLRRIASWIHLYGGLALGGLLVLISVSGSVLVFEDPLDEWLRPDLHRVTPSGDRASMDRVVGAVTRTHPQATPWIVALPATPSDPAVVRLGPEAPSVYVDPYRATILGEQKPSEGVINTIAGLHTDLLAGRPGGVVVGIVGLLLVVLTATGLVLWWPRRLRGLWRALRVSWRRGAFRFNYDLHRAGGFYAAVFLLLTALTGSAFVFYPTTQQLVATLTATQPWPPAPPTVKMTSGETTVSYQAAIRAAEDALPAATPTYLYVPQEDDAPVTVRLRTPPEWHPNGRSFAYVHPTTGHVLRVDDARQAPWGAQVLQTFYPLHVGAVGGVVVRWLYVVLGLAPAILSVTGTIIWYRRWRHVQPPDETRTATEENVRLVLDEASRKTGEPVEIPPRP